MSTAPHTIEKPAHIDERRMRHISDADLFAALDLSRPELAAVRAAAQRADWAGAYQAWGDYFAARPVPVPVLNLDGYASLPPALLEARGQPIIAQARQLATTPYDFTGASHGRTPLYGVHYLLWLLPLLHAFALDRDPAHSRAFFQLFNQWYETRDQVFGEIESLDVIWYTLGLAHRSLIFAGAYQAFRHTAALDPQTHARMLKSLLGASRWLSEEHDRFFYGNWQLTGVSALYEIGVIFPEFAEAAAWRASAWQRIQDHLELDVYPDGGHSERSPSYHQHVMACLARVASVAELNGQPPLQANPRFAAMYHWLLAQTSPLGCTTNFNDSHLIWPSQWAVQGAVLLEDPQLKWLAEQFATPDQLAWTLAGLPKRPAGLAAQVFAQLASQPPRLESHLLDTSKFAIQRSGHGPDSLFMAINYGPLVGHEYESHSHLDALSFICAGYGRPLAVEAGLPLTSYDDPLYKTWIRSAAAHNVVLVDDTNPDDQAKDADLLAWSSGAAADLFEAEHAGYLSRGVRHRRLVLFVKGEYWIVFDELRQSGPHRLDWRIYTPQPFEMGPTGLRPTQAPGLAVLPVLPAAAGHFDAIHGTMAVAAGPAYEPNGEFREVHGLSHVQATAAPRATFVHILYPIKDLAQSSALSARALPLPPAAGEACAIEHAGGTDLFFIRDAQSAPLMTLQAWRSDARLAWLRSRAHWAVFDARWLELEDAPVFTSSAPLRALSLRPAASGLSGTVETTRQTELSLFVDGRVEDAFINGVRLHAARVSGNEARLLLLAPGTYQFQIIQRP